MMTTIRHVYGRPFAPGSKCWKVIRFFEAHHWGVDGTEINSRVDLARKWTNRVSDIREHMGTPHCILCIEQVGRNAAGERITETFYGVPAEFRSAMRRLAPDAETEKEL